MHNHVGYRWIKTFLNKFIRIIICLTLVYMPFFANAGAAEKWTIEEVVYDNIGKNLSYKSSRPNANAANDYVYKAKVGVTAARTGSTVANMVRMGVAGAAIYGIVEGVGWIIDQGKIVRKVEEDSGSNPTIKNCYSALSICVSTPEVLAQLLTPKLGGKSFTLNKPNKYIQIYKNPDKSHLLQVVTYTYITNPDYNPDFKNEPVPDSEVGAAVNNSPVAPSVLPDIYHPNNPAGGEAPKATDDALDNAVPEPRTDPNIDIKNKPNKDTNGDSVPDVYDPESPSEGSEFELPKFCSWAAVVCEWYSKYNENDDLDTDNEPPEIKEIDIDALDTSTFTGVAGCPAPITVPITFGDGGETEISYEPICQLAEKWSFVAPMIGFLSGAMIIVGVGRKGEDGEI